MRESRWFVLFDKKVRHPCKEVTRNGECSEQDPLLRHQRENRDRYHKRSSDIMQISCFRFRMLLQIIRPKFCVVCFAVAHINHISLFGRMQRTDSNADVSSPSGRTVRVSSSGSRTTQSSVVLPTTNAQCCTRSSSMNLTTG